MDRDIDPRATCVPILAFFDTAAMKGPGLPVKLAMFDIAAPPDDAVCIYVDLDSVIIGNLDPLAQLTDSAPIWTIDVFPRRFFAIYRML